MPLNIIESALTAGTDGIIGQPELGGADLEIDLPHGVVRFFTPSDCQPSELAYWARRDIVHSIELTPFQADQNRIFGPVSINGVRFRALFDTGAPTTGLTAKTAELAGVTPQSPGVVESGFIKGIGPAQLKNWTGHFTSFEVGGETIANPIFDFSDKTNASADLILGADFFRRHRVYVAKRQHVLAFTDEGVDMFGIDWNQPVATAAGEARPH